MSVLSAPHLLPALLVPPTRFTMQSGRGLASDTYTLTMQPAADTAVLAQCEGLPSDDSVCHSSREAMATGRVLTLFTQTNPCVGVDADHEMRSSVYDPFPDGRRRYRLSEATPPFCVSEAVARSLYAGGPTELVLADRSTVLTIAGQEIGSPIHVDGRLMELPVMVFASEAATLQLVRGTRLVHSLMTEDADCALLRIDEAPRSAVQWLEELFLHSVIDRASGAGSPKASRPAE